MSYNGNSTVRALAPEYRRQFEAARTKLQRAGWKVTRSGYDHGSYFVSKGNAEYQCTVWDVIRRAGEL